jgi:hypothetical protein
MTSHRIDHFDIASIAEIDGDMLWGEVWCHVHRNYELHWLPRPPERVLKKCGIVITPNNEVIYV